MKPYSTPKIIVHGSLTEMTKTTKPPGSNDQEGSFPYR